MRGMLQHHSFTNSHTVTFLKEFMLQTQVIVFFPMEFFLYAMTLCGEILNCISVKQLKLVCALNSNTLAASTENNQTTHV